MARRLRLPRVYTLPVTTPSPSSCAPGRHRAVREADAAVKAELERTLGELRRLALSPHHPRSATVVWSNWPVSCRADGASARA